MSHGCVDVFTETPVDAVSKTGRFVFKVKIIAHTTEIRQCAREMVREATTCRIRQVLGKTNTARLPAMRI